MINPLRQNHNSPRYFIVGAGVWLRDNCLVVLRFEDVYCRYICTVKKWRLVFYLYNVTTSWRHFALFRMQMNTRFWRFSFMNLRQVYRENTAANYVHQPIKFIVTNPNELEYCFVSKVCKHQNSLTFFIFALRHFFLSYAYQSPSPAPLNTQYTGAVSSSLKTSQLLQ